MWKDNKKMSVEQISAFEFTCTPWDRNCPIKQMVIIIYAKDRKEAELIKLNNDYKFFNQDLTISVRELGMSGYRRLMI